MTNLFFQYADTNSETFVFVNMKLKEENGNIIVELTSNALDGSLFNISVMNQSSNPSIETKFYDEYLNIENGKILLTIDKQNNSIY
ncbi:MAG: hypothetical protein N4A57_16840 [Anaeromicrobium sp.]|jgi:hypothetical protein|uniref:hypothetical protein n=1 Tax=Anaeromicrobium sp. TaxID=1929132 RepID=UPI0025EBA8E9|nr:hypothetical protein [Anaeromicrobium sp.]MCT4595914.1 hypothetical protein [Anaeromicrobium sp.]